MKTTILYLILSVALFSCKKDDITVTPTPEQSGYVPTEAVGKWLYGAFSMTEYWAYNGSYLGNAFELSVAFNFTENGQYEQYFISQTNNYGCNTQALSYYKGSVEFNEEDSSFTVYPAEGNYRGYYSCSPNYNFDRDAEQSELKVQTFYYTFETDSYGKKWMVVKFDPNDEYGSYFAPSNW